MNDHHAEARRAEIRRIHREQLERESRAHDAEPLPVRIAVSALFVAALALGIAIACL